MGIHKVILVGENNICRSFMGERLLQGILKKRKALDVEVLSRGLVVLFSEPVVPDVADILVRHGYSISGVRSCQLTQEDIDSADLILTMQKYQVERIKDNYNVQTSCMFIGDFTGLEEELPLFDFDEKEEFSAHFHVMEQVMEVVADRIIGEMAQ